MMVSFILFLLPALLATASAQGDALLCIKCTDATSCEKQETCQGTKAAGGCFALVEENTLAADATKSTGFSKGCVDASNSGLKELITFTVGTDKYLRMNAIQCSDKASCNSAVPEVPQENKKVNNLQCPTCFALNSASCNSQNNPCTGDETSCIDFTGTLTKGSPASSTSFAGKGCATKSAANIKTGTILVSGGSTYEFTKLTATDAQAVSTTPKATTTTATTATTSGGSPALGKFSFALFLPGLTGLLLVKLLS